MTRRSPPALLVGALLAQLGLRVAVPAGWDPSAGLLPPFVAVGAGSLLMAAGVALHLAADRAFAVHRTTRATRGIPRTMVTDGVYGWTRNPMYLGGALFLGGTALLMGSGWGMLVVPAWAGAVTRLYIVPEESVLRRRFEERWLGYAARVGRWI